MTYFGQIYVRFGQNKARGTAVRERSSNLFNKILNSEAQQVGTRISPLFFTKLLAYLMGFLSG